MNKMVLLPDPSSPLIYLDFALLYGAVEDPSEKDGLASITASMLLRGTKNKKAAAFHQALDDLGAEVHLGKYKESLRIYCIVLAANLNPLLNLVEEMLIEPAFSEEEFKKVKALMKSALYEELGSDDEIAERRFQEYFLYGHPYGRITAGSLRTIENIQLEDCKNFYKKYFRREAFVFGATGAIQKASLQKRVQKILDQLPKSGGKALQVSAPPARSGRRFLFLTKPARTQSQIHIGAPGIKVTDPDYAALQLANHVFGGGSFSARLMSEVREKRGWSYGAYSSFRSGKQPLYFLMHTIPSNKDSVPAVKLMLEMYRDFHRNGIKQAEYEFAKQSLVNQSAFMQDTMRKRLDNKMSEIILGLPAGFYDAYLSRVKSLNYSKVQAAIQKKVQEDGVLVQILGSQEEVLPALESTFSGEKIITKAFDAEPVEIW